MNWQALLVGAIVGAAAYHVGRLLWRTWKGDGDGHCDKCGK
jgi:hypothetical protein